jgi:hypothetical protein
MNVSAQDVFDDFAKEARGYVLEIPAVTNLKDVSTVSVARHCPWQVHPRTT